MNLKRFIQDKILNLKSKANEYFILKNSLQHLSNFIKKSYVFSIGFDDIYYGNKNAKQLKISIFILAYLWFTVFYGLSSIFNDYMFSMMDIPLFSGHLRQLVMLGTSIVFLDAMFKTDYLIGEINCNLNPFKVFYYLMMNWKRNHQLNDKNYKKLAILSRIIQFGLIDFGIIFILIVIYITFIQLAILSKNKLFWISFIVTMTPVYINVPIITISTICLYIIIFKYYIMIFDQINDQINLILCGNKKSKLFQRRPKAINKTNQRKLINLIDQHNKASIEIDNINLIIRRSIASLFINISIVKIMSLYLLVNWNQFIIKILLSFIFFIIVTFSFGVCYIFTLQIKSAHQPQKTIYSIVCKYKLNLRFKLKVS